MCFQTVRRSVRYLTSMISVLPSLQSTRKSGVYRRDWPSCSNRSVIGCAVTRAFASTKLVSVTKSRSSALSCSVTPVARAWKPITCERRLSGIRRRLPSIRRRLSSRNLAHTANSSQTWNQTYGRNPLYRLILSYLSDSRNLEQRQKLVHETASRALARRARYQSGNSAMPERWVHGAQRIRQVPARRLDARRAYGPEAKSSLASGPLFLIKPAQAGSSPSPPDQAAHPDATLCGHAPSFPARNRKCFPAGVLPPARRHR